MKIVDGTHLGCLWERELPNMTIQGIKDLLIKEYNEGKLFSNFPKKDVNWVVIYCESGLKAYVLEDKKENIVFEWYVKEKTEKE